jgi:hypothetical protein
VAKKSVWMKIGRGNDWGSIYYAEKSKVYSSGGTCDSSRGLKLKKGPIDVKWPDGTESKETLRTIVRYEHINDMGHEYNASGYEWGFYHDVHGVKQWFELSTVQIKRNQFKTKEGL